MKRLLVYLLLILLAGCVTKPVVPPPETPPVTPAPEPPPVVKVEPPFKAVEWADVDGWLLDCPAVALETFQKSCKAVGKRKQWRTVCVEAVALGQVSDQQARKFFEDFFQPHEIRKEDGNPVGLITGYYGPELEGSRVKTAEYKYPIYRQPDDLLIIDLRKIYPELGKYRLRGRVVGNRVVPYFKRGEIDARNTPLAGEELFWLKDPVDAFFLQIQGSGRVILPDGERVMVGYANQNGHPYRSIGKLLLDRQEMTRNQMSMQNIKKWVEENPEAGRQLLNENPSYVFFRSLPSQIQSPPGALGVPLTPLRSIAVDPHTIPLGAPVFLSTTFPGEDLPLRQLMVAQDTGGAIKGRVRADFFWGMGDDAGRVAGRMKQDGRLWILLPKTAPADHLSQSDLHPGQRGTIN